ncbi:MAG: TolC family protein [Acidobacteriaceae bacterium]
MLNRRKIFGFGMLCAVAITCGTVPFCSMEAQSQGLPEAPAANLISSAAQTSAAPAQTVPFPMPPMPVLPSTTGMGSANSAKYPKLTIAQAEQIALKNNPNISVAQLLALAQKQVTREVRSAELPTVTGAVMAVDANQNGRIVADAQSPYDNPRILPRAAAGAQLNQLITDFGHTGNLVRSAKFNAQAKVDSEKATELDITLVTDEAFYAALSAQAVLKVAQQTVEQRQSTDQQVRALTKTKIRSDLDLSFADVQLSQAKLMLLNAQNNEQAAMAALNDVLGSEKDMQYSLVDETNNNPAPAPDDAEALVKVAFAQRPDLAALNDQYIADQHYSRAERDLWMPSVNALGAGGGAPVRSDDDGDLIKRSWFGVAGVNVSIPIFNGFLFNAEEAQANLQTKAMQQQIRSLRDTIARDVRTSVLNAQTAFQRIAVTEQMLYQANFALALATARYKLGLSGIVEITESQLNETQAAIDNANARYTYQTAMAVVRYELGQ